jgi:hypothetical protein
MRFLLAAAAAVLLLTLAGGAGAQSPSVFGTVGPGFLIRLSDASGNPVTHLDPGTYTFQIEDKGDIHNFHLTGPGVDRATDIEQTGTFMWTVTLTDGRYHYQCDPHASTMKGDFTVGTPPPPPPPPPTTTPAKKAVALSATVGPGATIALRTLAGRKLVSLKAGPVVITVKDLSAKHNFHLVGPGVNRATSRPGKARVTWRVTLKRGLYTYRSDATPKLRGTFRAV